MTKIFKPKQATPLEVIYTTRNSKEWIKKQSDKHKISMVQVIDDMVTFCAAHDKGDKNAE